MNFLDLLIVLSCKLKNKEKIDGYSQSTFKTVEQIGLIFIIYLDYVEIIV